MEPIETPHASSVPLQEVLTTHRKFSWITLGIVVVITASLSSWITLHFEKPIQYNVVTNSPTTNSTDSTNVITQIATTTDATANWKTYTNTEFSFEIKYPDDRKILDEKVNTGGTFSFRLESTKPDESPMVFTVKNTGSTQYYTENTIGPDSDDSKLIISSFRYTN